MTVRLTTKVSLDRGSLEVGDRVRLDFEGGESLVLEARDIPWQDAPSIFLGLDPTDEQHSPSLVARLGHQWAGDGPQDWGPLILWSRLEVGAGVFFKKASAAHAIYLTPEAMGGSSTPKVTHIEPM